MYNLILRLFYLLAHLPLPGYNNRKVWLSEQRKIFHNLKPNKKKSIWIHCSSLGEYEYIKPLLSELTKNHPITITFFSPSGYMHFKDFNLIDRISYLPFDFKKNMQKFINAINPTAIIISKNDIWPNMMTCISNKKIPCFLIGFKIKKHKTKNWFSQKYYISNLSKFTHVFCQNELTYNFLMLNNIKHCSIVGDMRINQIIMDATQKLQDSKITTFIQEKNTTIIYGSVEISDYPIIIDFINNRTDVNHIIVPHDINKKTINTLTKFIKQKYLIYSEIKNIPNAKNNILIVDCFGILKKLYQYSKIAYVGGGFNQGVHNTLEAVAHGNYILFGPKHAHFEETHFLIKNKIAFALNNKHDFNANINILLHQNDDTKKEVLNISKRFLNKNKQDITPILDHIQNHIGIK